MKKEIAKILLNLNAVSLRLDPPFTWASGRLSPIYCDNRLIISSPENRQFVANSFVESISNLGWKPEVIAGTATAGIPHAAWVADIMNLPMIYVRASAKGHGRQNKIEGYFTKGAKVVLIEDLISTGKSSIEAALGVKEAGGDLLGIVSIFTYGLKIAHDQFKDADIEYHSLTDFDSLLITAKETGRLDEQQQAIISSWKTDPSGWSKKRGGAS